MILAGGMSTRLYPLTRALPKPLVPVAGEPNSAHVMRYLRSYGIDEIAINVHYLADAIRAAFGDGSAYGVHLHYLHEPVLLGSAGAVKQMEPFFDDTFVVVGCDDLTNAPLDRLVAFHKERGALATIGLVQADDVTEYGVVILDERGKIVEFQEKPPRGTERSHLVNTGIYVFEPAIFEHIPAATFYDFGKQVFPALQGAGAPFYGLDLGAAYWRDIGTLAEYRNATNDVLTGRMQLPGSIAATGVAPDVVIGDGATLAGPLHVGSGVRIGARARIVGPSVLGDRVEVGDDAVIERSILWDGARIGAGAALRDSIVGIGYSVAPGERLVDAAVAGEPEAVAS
jgi:NDP-sugar pyrophosphorylase family protein